MAKVGMNYRKTSERSFSNGTPVSHSYGNCLLPAVNSQNLSIKLSFTCSVIAHTPFSVRLGFGVRDSNSHKTQLSFIFGKARVAPTKALSIPKIELHAALLATRLKDDILKELTVNINHVYM